MLELLGSGYVVEHCVSTFSEYCKQEIFKSYIADGIKCISESVANRFGGSYLQNRYVEVINEKEEAPVSGDEIVIDIISRAGLKVRE